MSKQFTAAPLAYELLLPIVRNLREADQREIYAVRWDDGSDPDQLARDIMNFKGAFGFVCGFEHPIAVVAATAMHPGVWAAWSFGTDEIGKIMLPLTRVARKYIVETLRKQGAHRIECYSWAGHKHAHKWLKVLGAEREGAPLERFGKNGETFLRYRMLLNTAGCGGEA